jgi:hypothetical protein
VSERKDSLMGVMPGADQERDKEQKRIAARRATLCGVDSVVSVPDFEVREQLYPMRGG